MPRKSADVLRSMTGFGAGSAEGRDLSARAEVRSVNHRHLLVKSRLPTELASLESEIEGLAKKRLSRGSVAVSVQVTKAPGAALASLDRALAARYADELRRLATELGLDEEVRLDQILALPGVLGGDRDDGAMARAGKLVLAAVKDALGELTAMREREGAALAADLAKNVAAIRRTVAQIEKRMPGVVRAAQQALRDRIAELVGDRVEIGPADLAREIAVIADRGDVSEELSRLASHLDQFEALLDEGGAIGRKFDFLVQEMFREANTVGAKCGDAGVSQLVVDVKTRLERLREQVQNVE